MTKIAITGAAGNVGTQVRQELSDHELTLITQREHDEIDSDVCDVRDVDGLTTSFAGNRVVVHLAANPLPSAEWESVVETNVNGTYNVYEAARAAGIERVVFASTNHVQQMYNIADAAKPTSSRREMRTVDHDDPFRPTSYYGVSKVTGEALGSYYADRYGIEVVNVRIGWLLTEADLRVEQSREETMARYARAVWLSPRDCRHGLRRTVEADLPENPLTVNLLSRNQERYFSLAHTLRGLDYRPRDDSADVLER